MMRTIIIILIISITLSLTVSAQTAEPTPKAKEQCAYLQKIAERQRKIGNLQKWLKYLKKHGRCLTQRPQTKDKGLKKGRNK